MYLLGEAMATPWICPSLLEKALYESDTKQEAT